MIRWTAVTVLALSLLTVATVLFEIDREAAIIGLFVYLTGGTAVIAAMLYLAHREEGDDH